MTTCSEPKKVRLYCTANLFAIAVQKWLDVFATTKVGEQRKTRSRLSIGSIGKVAALRLYGTAAASNTSNVVEDTYCNKGA